MNPRATDGFSPLKVLTVRGTAAARDDRPAEMFVCVTPAAAAARASFEKQYRGAVSTRTFDRNVQAGGLVARVHVVVCRYPVAKVHDALADLAQEALRDRCPAS